MTHLSDRVERISISGTHRVFEAAGEDAINLGLGQPDFSTPDHARQAAVEAIEVGGADGYTRNKSPPNLREAITEKHRRDQGVDLGPNDVTAAAGGSEALYIVIEVHVNEGDEVIIPDPGFVSYDVLTKLVGDEPMPVPFRDDLTLDLAAVEDVIIGDTVMFVVNNPGDPMDAVSLPDGIAESTRITDERGVLCISDEVYEYIVFEGKHHSPIEFAETDDVVVANSTSKLSSVTGWQLGWVYGSARRAEWVLCVHQYMQACAPAPVQFAVGAAFNGSQGHIEEMTEAFRERHDLVIEGLEDIDLTVPSSDDTSYVMPEMPEGFVDGCIDHDVIIVPGEAFSKHGHGYARLPYMTDTKSLCGTTEIMGRACDAVV